MSHLKIIITGATGMVGEGVLMHCLQDPQVSEVLMINRKTSDINHPKLRELLLTDFRYPETELDRMKGYDACFYCAGVSSVGMNEADYTRITYDTTLAFASALLRIAPDMTFNFVTGAHTNINGKQMWQKVKGRTEEALRNLGFKGQYNFRPGFMKPVKGQQNVRRIFRPVISLYPLLFPSRSLTLHEVGSAMLYTTLHGYETNILEIPDIRKAARAEQLSTNKVPEAP